MKRILITMTLAVTAIIGLWAQEQYSGNIVAGEGAWCWFADPRALHYENSTGTINATYLGYIDVHGNIMATQYDWRTMRKTDVLIRSYFQPDDHNNPTFLVLPDERVMIFYTRHTDEPKIWYRISKNPGDITALGEEKYLATANNTTYPSPFILSDDPTHIYLCWRGINWHPTIARITMPDQDGNCQFDFGPKQIVQSTGARPYAKYQSNGKDKIYLSYTTGHPDNEMPDWLYFNVIDINHGNGPILRDIKGTELKKVAEGVFNVNKQTSYASTYPLTVVDNSSNIRNWVWQVVLDANENPVIAYPHIDDAKTTHVYWYARWTGSEWRRTWVQYGGHAFHQNWNQTERCYSGGMSIDPDNINDLYLSIPTRNGDYNKDGVYEIWKYTINDAGEVAGKEQITKNSAKNNTRPYIIPGSKNSPMRLGWMNGDYYYWMVNKNYPQGYPTDIRCDYAWQEELTKEDESSPRTDCICLSANKTLTIAFAMDEQNYEGKLFTIGRERPLVYSIGTDYYPVITIGDKTFKSQNPLLTSDNWANASSGTNGDNHPTKVSTWVLTLTYDGQVLTTYRNGLVDQVIEIDNLESGTADAYGDEYHHTILIQRDYYACASPLTVQALSATALRATLPTALQNGDFEGAYTVLAGSGVSNDRAIYLPEGWNITRTNGDVNDLTALKAGDLYFNDFFSSFTKPEANGAQTYWIRQKWGASTITLWQKVLLPEGKYTLSCSLWKSGLGGDAKVNIITEGGTTVSSPTLGNMEAWQTVTLNFESNGTAATTVQLSAIHNSDGSTKFIGWDNVVITKRDDTDPQSEDAFNFRLRNSLGFDRTDETVVVNIPEGITPSTCTLTDEEGNVIPFEAIGQTSIRFQATVAAGKTKGYTLAEGTPSAPAKLTYTAIKSPNSRDDIAWENDLSAYRMYAAKLLSSEPNTAQGVDVWSKKQADPIIDAMYGLSNYHNESQYGVDAYSVNGKRLGCGGVAVVENGHLVMHDPYNTCTITTNDALASAFTLTYNNVKAGTATYTETLNVETQAGALLNRGTVRLDGAAGTIRLAVALYQHTDMSHTVAGTAFTGVPGLIGWAENKSEGSVTSPNARFFQGAYIPQNLKTSQPLNLKTEVIDNHLCLTFDYTIGTEQTFYFGAGWNIFPAGRYATDDDWFDALEQFRDKVLSPLTVTSMTELPTKASVTGILNTVNQTWQERNPAHGDYFWNRAVYHIGNMAAYEATGDGVYRDFSTAWATKNNWWGATGTNKANWKYKNYGEGADYVLFGDNQVCFQVYADLYKLDETPDETKIARALEVMDYEISTSAVDYLWWVDGLFMVMPIMTKLYNITGNQTYLDKMYQYWQYANSIMYDNETGLYFRDAKYVYPAHTTNNGKKDFWARGDGWIFAGFAKVLSELPITDSHRDEYITYYRRLAAALKDCQQAEGYWTRSLLDPAQAPGYETSGTALNTFAYAWGIRNGILDELEYGQTLERAWHYLSTIALQSDGTVGYIQPIGESASPNTTVNASNYHDFGVGAYLLAASEMSRLAVGEAVKPHLRLSEVTLVSPTEINIRFNLQPNASEAANTAHYTINGQPIVGQAVVGVNNTVTITLSDTLNYGRYTIAVEGIHSADGGEMQAGQERLVVLTVPLDAPQTDIIITAEGSQSGNPHTNVNDGSLDTRWSYEGMNKWIRFDLREIKHVYAVDVAFYSGNTRVFYFKVQTSTNGTTWTDATDNLISSGLTNEMERYYFTPVDARYVRLLCSGNSTNNWNSPTEVRIRYTDSEDPNGIHSMNNGQSTMDNEIYDLSGRKMNAQLPKGIYIISGHKVIIC